MPIYPILSQNEILWDSDEKKIPLHIICMSGNVCAVAPTDDEDTITQSLKHFSKAIKNIHKKIETDSFYDVEYTAKVVVSDTHFPYIQTNIPAKYYEDVVRILECKTVDKPPKNINFKQYDTTNYTFGSARFSETGYVLTITYTNTALKTDTRLVKLIKLINSTGYKIFAVDYSRGWIQTNIPVSEINVFAKVLKKIYD